MCPTKTQEKYIQFSNIGVTLTSVPQIQDIEGTKESYCHQSNESVGIEKENGQKSSVNFQN